MGELISGKEALIALANGKEVEYKTQDGEWNPIPELLDSMKIRLKPRTIKIGNVDVPAPFEPKAGDEVWILCTNNVNGYRKCFHASNVFYLFPPFRAKEEIKQVVEALRSVFNG